jgi:hypothetical protein
MYSRMGVKSSNTYGWNCAAEAINTTFNTFGYVKAEQWQGMDIETLAVADLHLFIKLTIRNWSPGCIAANWLTFVHIWQKGIILI